jgi:hypothetical protein
VLPVLSKAVVGDVEFGNLLVIKSFENSLTSCYPDTAPVPFIVPLTEITELQLLLTIIAQSSLLLLKVIDANNIRIRGKW